MSDYPDTTDEMQALIDRCADLSLMVAQLTNERDNALRALDRERESLPREGLWIVTEESGRRMRWIAVADLPDPITMARLERLRDTMAVAILRVFREYAEKRRDGYMVFPSAYAVTDAIMQDCHAEIVKQDRRWHLSRIEPECLRPVVDYLGTETFLIHEDDNGQYVRIGQQTWQWMQGLLEESMFERHTNAGEAEVQG